MLLPQPLRIALVQSIVQGVDGVFAAVYALPRQRFPLADERGAGLLCCGADEAVLRLQRFAELVAGQLALDASQILRLLERVVHRPHEIVHRVLGVVLATLTACERLPAIFSPMSVALARHLPRRAAHLDVELGAGLHPCLRHLVPVDRTEALVYGRARLRPAMIEALR